MNEIEALHGRYDAGSQMWFSAQKRFGQDTRLHHYGCGVIAMTDFCTYKHLLERTEDRQEYKNRIRHMERCYMHIFPGFGISPYFYSFYANWYYRIKGIPYRFRRIWLWGNRKQREKKLRRRITEQLRADLPLIFAAGPVIPGPWKNSRIPLYRQENGQLKESGQKVKSHYMTILGLYEDQGQLYMKIATWGEIRYMRLTDYMKHGRCSIPFSNTVYATRMIQK